MSIKLTGNGMWESSRMMLPEHVQRINENYRRRNVKEKPILDADVVEDIERAISESLTNRSAVTLRLFDEYEDLTVIGTVERVDTFGRRVRIDGEWFRVDDVISASVNEA